MAVQQKNNGKNKKSSGFGFFWIFLLVVLLPKLFELMEDGDLEFAFQRFFSRLRYWAMRNGLPTELPMILMSVAVVVVVFVIVAAAASAKKKRAENTNTRSGRTSAAVQRPDPRTRSFSEPDPYCVVCDHTGEDHFQRDKAQRLRQLDDWLKIGLIDREEYRVLHDRFERGI